MKKLIRFSWRYTHQTHTYKNSKRKFIITGYAFLTATKLKRIIKAINNEN